MEDCSEYEAYAARLLLLEFAARLHALCQAEPVTIFYSGKGFRINAVEIAEGGLNLILEGHGYRFIAMEDIRKNTFYRKHGDVSCWIVPEWM